MPEQGSSDSDSDVISNGYSGFLTVSGATALDLDAGVYAV